MNPSTLITCLSGASWDKNRNSLLDNLIPLDTLSPLGTDDFKAVLETYSWDDGRTYAFNLIKEHKKAKRDIDVVKIMSAFSWSDAKLLFLDAFHNEKTVIMDDVSRYLNVFSSDTDKLKAFQILLPNIVTDEESCRVLAKCWDSPSMYQRAAELLALPTEEIKQHQPEEKINTITINGQEIKIQGPIQSVQSINGVSYINGVNVKTLH